MATVLTQVITEWNNFHLNGPFPTKMLLDIDTDRSIGSLLDRFNDSTQAIQSLLNKV
jgi:hypothetical protein